MLIVTTLQVLTLTATQAQGSVECQPRSDQTRKQIESCLGKPVKVVKLKDDRKLTFDVAWYSSQRQDQFKYYRVAYVTDNVPSLIFYFNMRLLSSNKRLMAHLV